MIHTNELGAPGAARRMLLAITLGISALALPACQGGGGGGGETLNSPGGGYGVTSNVGTMDEDLIQNESPDQDPLADNPDPIPN